MHTCGVITYLKPGSGIEPDEANGDLKFTFKLRFRYVHKLASLATGNANAEPGITEHQNRRFRVGVPV
jgi:hypothetical protein